MIDFPKSGIAAVDAYLADGFETVRGMSSRFSAGVVGHLLRRQSEMGVCGSVAEIGTFEGRFFVAMALALAPGEKAYGFDLFSWPDDKVLDRLTEAMGRFAVPEDRWSARIFNSGDLTPRDFIGMTGSKPLRFIHIDGDHSPEALAHDLTLAHESLHHHGLICLDDMLHPGYPFLVVAVHDYLKKHGDMRLMAVIDREDIVAAPKFLICRADAVSLYENDLMASFPKYHFILGGDAMGHHCVVLTQKPRIADV